MISINIFNRDEEVDQKKNLKFFERDVTGNRTFNTAIWNNPEIVKSTGYSIEFLKDVLYKLAMFIRINLTPDRLEGFNLEHIKQLGNFEPSDSESFYLIL